MTARGATDSIALSAASNASYLIPNITTYSPSTFTAVTSVPNAIITFSDGIIGYFYMSEVFSAITSVSFNSSSGTKEYGQLFNLPFPLRIYGIYGWMFPSISTSDVDVILYSVPLSGSPVAEKTRTVDANTIQVAGARKFATLFSSPYTYTANTDIAAVFKPGASSVSVFYKTFASSAHRVAEVFGTSGYGISRSSGAFANVNSSLDHFYIGLLVGAFDAGGAAGRAVQINNDSLVA